MELSEEEKRVFSRAKANFLKNKSNYRQQISDTQPVPRSPKSRDFDPSRWVCCKRPEKCDGIFRVYGQAYLCPLLSKCLMGERNQYQWSYGQRRQGRYPLLSEHFCHKMRWDDRRNALMMAFRGDYLAEKRKISRARHGKEFDRRSNAKRAAAKKLASPPKIPKTTASDRAVYPCGEDCENCPYDVCQYGDRDDDARIAAARREQRRQYMKAYYERNREKWREKGRRYREKKRDKMQKKQEKEE